ncbi:MAG: M23 family metallopeptidase [Deltaproteobacteria bacterium]|jgi:murein DD-endopeptidase MepM/ murein hydrolase activator NlpD
MKKSKFAGPFYFLIALLLCGLAGSVVWIVVTCFEGEKPVFQISGPFHTIGKAYTLKGSAADQKSGLRRVWVAILQQGKETVFFDQTFPSKGLLRRGLFHERPVSTEMNVEALGLADGEALLRTAVWDYSYRGWWSGNRTYAEYEIVIDTRPPTIDILTRTHNLNQGGAGLVIYRISESGTVNGVQVAEHFFPGYSGLSSDPSVHVAFFALPYDKGRESELYVTATDAAGNTYRTGFVHHINAKEFERDSVRLSETFLRQKMPEFEGVLGMSSPSASLVEKFVMVNRSLRRANNNTIKEACKESEAKLYWNGPFLRLPQSARQAGFADHRKYELDGRTLDEQVHLGIDLASTAHSPVPAANHGRVVFAENLGIYGNTVIIDHGFGLFSMYGHLSRIQVEKDQMVSKGDVIGLTGMTGLAGGDHLHYSMIVGDTFVNPIEWWDPQWIEHNVSDKLAMLAPGDEQ